MGSLLAFDTSTEVMSIALDTPSGVRVREAAGGAQASARLLPDILVLLAEAGTSLAQLDAIAFGRGPGAFTGLRTACSVAQGLALGAGKPALPVDSLLLVAEDARRQHAGATDVWVAMDARMDEVYAGAYAWDGARWSVRSAPALYAVEALNDRWRESPPACVAGSALQAFAGRLSFGEALAVPEARSRAEALLAVARQLWAEGMAVDAAEALPLYLRDKVAQTTVERDAVRLAKAAVAEAAP